MGQTMNSSGRNISHCTTATDKWKSQEGKQILPKFPSKFYEACFEKMLHVDDQPENKWMHQVLLKYFFMLLENYSLIIIPKKISTHGTNFIDI